MTWKYFEHVPFLWLENPNFYAIHALKKIAIKEDLYFIKMNQKFESGNSIHPIDIKIV